MDIKRLEELFVRTFGCQPRISRISGGGGSRKYFRLSAGGQNVVGVIGDDIKENECFFVLNDLIRKTGVNVPEIITISDDKKLYLLQDLGDVSLFHELGADNSLNWGREALKSLIKIQTIPETEWANKIGFKPFSERLVMWDLNYFKYDFLKPSDILFDEEALEDDFELLKNKLSSPGIVTGLMYRDFQSRNIMIFEDKLWFIDFQAARKGPVAYDAVSFIWQAKAPFTYGEREDLENFYAGEFEKRGFPKEEMLGQMRLMAVFRTLQVLGAYGFRGIIERKQHFIDSIPFAIKNLDYLSEKGCLDDYPEIKRIAICLKDKYLLKKETDEDTLTLTVFSFSYKKGYPEDSSGNGGGFMFDCRAIHNPGRYAEYKSLTGNDREVIEFLEKTDEAGNFVKHALNIVTPSIERYLKRNFTSLQVGFGCTGGQHRSVYCAERFAKEIKERYPQIKVKLIHREQL